MAPVPEAAFRALLAGRSRDAVAAFVADLWHARGMDVTREGDRLFVDGRELRVVADPADASPPEDGVLVSATPPGPDADDDVVGPADLHRMLLYDAPRERAATLFEDHFDRPLDGDWPVPASDEPSGTPGGAGTPTGGEAEVPPVLPDALRRPLIAAGARVPRDAASVRSAASDPRVAVALVALLVVLAGAWVGLFVHRPAPDRPTAAPFSAADAGLPVEGTYRVEGVLRTTVDGETFSIAGSRTYAPGDPSVAFARWTYGGPGGRTTVARYEGNGSYTRQTWTNASDYRSFRAARSDDEDFVYAADGSRAVYAADRSAVGADPDPAGGFPLSVLAQLPYERRGTTSYEGRTVVRYVPETGWVTRSYGLLDDRRTTWVRAASGEVLVTPDGGVVLHADVEASVVSADTWWGALTRPGSGLELRYSVRPGVDRPRPPPWVDGIRERQGANATG